MDAKPLTAEEQRKAIEWATYRYDLLEPVTSKQHLEETLGWYATVRLAEMQRDDAISAVGALERDCEKLRKAAVMLRRAYRNSLLFHEHTENSAVLRATAWLEKS